MPELTNTDFTQYTKSPEELASKVLQVYFNNRPLVFPIDPFGLMKEFNIAFQFRDFSKLEGIYIVPDDDADIPVVGININRPISRQRFTAAHEICHHIKDKDTIPCPISGRKSVVEIFADNFAAALLMPLNELKRVSENYIENGFVDFESILYISDYFAVSFEASVYRLAYKLNLIDGDIDSKILKKRINKFKPDSKRIHLGIRTQNLENLRNIINCTEFSFTNESQIIWEKFKINFVFNENRLEGVKIGYDEISEIITDLRLKKQDSEYCRSEYENIIDVVGHSSVFDYIYSTNDRISIFMILKLHQLMGQFHPYPGAYGQFRNTNNLVIDSKFETSDYHDISSEISKLGNLVDHLRNNIYSLPLCEYIEACIKIHHKLTVIHPFADGNGRISRAFLNWQFRQRGIPPIYFKYENKFTYFDALSRADLIGEYDNLFEVFYVEILCSMIELNSKYHYD